MKTIMKQLNIIEEQLKPSKDPVPSSRLKWLPGWEGVLKYDPQDIEQDRPMRLWHLIKRVGGKKVLFELKAVIFLSRLNKNYYATQRPRVGFFIKNNGDHLVFYRSHLLFYAKGKKKRKDNLCVVDHIDGNTLNDRPSNLQLISQKENIKRSKRFQESAKCPVEERKRRAKLRADYVNRLREEIKHSWGFDDGVTNMDVEIELSLRLQEIEFEFSKGGGFRVKEKGGSYVA